MWDLNYPHYSAQSDSLIDFANTMNLGLSFPINYIFTILEFKTVDSNYFIFLFSFVISFSFILFGDLGLGLTQHHSHTTIYQSHLTWKSVEGSRRMMSYSMFNTWFLG